MEFDDVDSNAMFLGMSLGSSAKNKRLRMAIFNNDSISEDLDVEDNAAMDD
jgi:hypothetical protein